MTSAREELCWRANPAIVGLHVSIALTVTNSQATEPGVSAVFSFAWVRRQ